MVRFAAFYFLLVVVHFIADWAFQSEEQAHRTATCDDIRSMHCAIYALCFVPFFSIFTSHLLIALLLIFWTFGTHWLVESCVPLKWWAKYIRRAAPFRTDDSMEVAFAKYTSTIEGYILITIIDQIIHIVVLAPAAWLMSMH